MSVAWGQLPGRPLEVNLCDQPPGFQLAHTKAESPSGLVRCLAGIGEVFEVTAATWHRFMAANSTVTRNGFTRN